MSFNVNTGLTSVTGNVTSVPETKLLKVGYAQGSGAGSSTTLATVTAGKTAYIVGYALSVYSIGTVATNGIVSILANGVVIGVIGARGTAVTTYAPNAVALSFPLGQYITAPATTTITVAHNADAGSIISNVAVYYYEL